MDLMTPHAPAEPPGAFCWYQLRTPDPEGALRFYGELLGWQAASPATNDERVLLHQGQPCAAISRLPARAAAAGAPAHWLGHIAAPQLPTAVQRLLALGAQPLGPVQRSADGAQVQVLRDPLGAVLALRDAPPATTSGAVAWHEHYCADPERAGRIYSEVFGWHLREALTLGDRPYRRFAFGPAGPARGGLASTAGAPQIHNQWLLYFRVAQLDSAVARVRAAGGVVLFAPLTLPGGDRVTVCDDPQGAAFALREPAAPDAAP